MSVGWKTNLNVSLLTPKRFVGRWRSSYQYLWHERIVLQFLSLTPTGVSFSKALTALCAEFW